MKKMSQEDVTRRCHKKKKHKRKPQEEEAEEEVTRRSCKGTEIVELQAQSEALQAEDSGN